MQSARPVAPSASWRSAAVVCALLTLALSGQAHAETPDAIRYAQVRTPGSLGQVPPGPVVSPAAATSPAGIVNPGKQIPPDIVPEKAALDRCGVMTITADRETCLQQYPTAVKKP